LPKAGTDMYITYRNAVFYLPFLEKSGLPLLTWKHNTSQEYNTPLHYNTTQFTTIQQNTSQYFNTTFYKNTPQHYNNTT